MNIGKALISAASEPLYVGDAFSAYPYPGSSGTQSITNDVDLAEQGGLVCVKARNSSDFQHMLCDTARGASNLLFSSSTVAQNNSPGFGVSAFNSDGFTVTDNSGYGVNWTENYISWTHRNAPNFFTHSTVGHTNGVATNVDLSYLGTSGFTQVKIASATGDWLAWHRSLTAGNNLRLNLTAAQSATNAWLSVSGTTLTISASAPTGTYVYHAWAHDDSPDGVIQCGSFTTDGSGAASFDFGWAEGVQFIELKCRSTTGDWEIYDTERTTGFSGNDARLRANLSSSEDSVARLSFSGTTLSFTGLSASQTYVFKAIRAPS